VYAIVNGKNDQVSQLIQRASEPLEKFGQKKKIIKVHCQSHKKEEVEKKTPDKKKMILIRNKQGVHLR